jgi:hypothetical protein
MVGVHGFIQTLTVSFMPGMTHHTYVRYKTRCMLWCIAVNFGGAR